jgi:hypothetical protein
MDPKYGEISRAMRNRGIEISLNHQLPTIMANPNDLRALIYSTGIHEVRKILEEFNFFKASMVQFLVEFHSELAKHLGKGRPASSFLPPPVSLRELLHCAQLLLDQHVRGFTKEISLENALGQAYWKCSKSVINRVLDIVKANTKSKDTELKMVSYVKLVIHFCS